MAPVEKGDTIFISTLDGADKKVEWAQRLQNKSADYEVLAYEVKTKGERSDTASINWTA
jgi:hypothetical protein